MASIKTVVTSCQLSFYPVSPKLRKDLDVIVFADSAVVLLLGSSFRVIRSETKFWGFHMK